jgi:hypothetical protein
MPAFKYLVTAIVLATGLFMAGCSLFSEEDVSVITDARQLLEEQKDANGDPIDVKLPVRLNYAISKKAMIDRDLEIEFEILTEQPLPVLRVGLLPSDGLELVDTDFREKFVDLKIREVINRQATVKPTSENKFYLDVYLITEIGEDKKAKLFRIPIGVGDYSLTDNPEPRPVAHP